MSVKLSPPEISSTQSQRPNARHRPWRDRSVRRSTTTLSTRSAKSFYSEIEAAQALGISIDRFRDLVRTHIAQSEDEVNNIGATTYQASDLLVLRLLAKIPVHS